jgi:hypothetical protein
VPLKHHTETAYLIFLAAIVSAYGVLLSLLPHFPQGVLYWMILMVVSFLYPIVLTPTFRSNRADYEFRFLHWAPALMTLLWLILEVFSGYKAILILQLGFLYLWSLPLVVLALTLIILFCLHVIRRQSMRVPVIGGLLAAFFALSISAEAFGWNTPMQTALFPDNQYARIASTVVPGSVSSSSSSTAVIAANVSSSSVAARSSSSAWALPPVSSSSRSSSSTAASSVRSSAAASLPRSAIAVTVSSSSSVRRSSSSLSSSASSVIAALPVSSSARSSSSLSSSAVSSSVARSSSSSSVATVVRSSSSSSAPAVIAQNPPPTPAPTPPHLPQSGPEAFALIMVTLLGLYCRTLHARAMRRLDVE